MSFLQLLLTVKHSEDLMSETKAKELTLCNEALSQLLVICLSLSFLHIYIESVHCTFTTFSN